MSLRPFRDISRKKTKVINVGNVKIGGDNPISVQSMTNTLTTNVKATIKQINDICEEGADLVRVSCPDEKSTFALKEISKQNENASDKSCGKFQQKFHNALKNINLIQNRSYRDNLTDNVPHFNRISTNS